MEQNKRIQAERLAKIKAQGCIPGSVVTCMNVNDALPQGLQYLNAYGKPAGPRGRSVIEAEVPIRTHYLYPEQCVLMDPVRLCNPFFHVMEMLWILAGRDDVEFLEFYNKKIRNYSDDGKSFYGAYGRRLRGKSEVDDIGIQFFRPDNDQFQQALDILKEDEESRRAVLTIWNQDDLGAVSKDIPCNDMLILSKRDGAISMTVICRSNDVIWGAYGANAVQFSGILQWFAAALHCKVGFLHQISVNYHVYTSEESASVYTKLNNLKWLHKGHNPYALMGLKTIPVVQDANRFDEEVIRFCDEVLEDQRAYNSMTEGHYSSVVCPHCYDEPYIQRVAIPLHRMYMDHKQWIRHGRPAQSPVEYLFTDANYWFRGQEVSVNIDWIAAAKQWLQIKEGTYIVNEQGDLEPITNKDSANA